jgi:hypothetical protein
MNAENFLIAQMGVNFTVSTKQCKYTMREQTQRACMSAVHEALMN